MFNEFWHDNDLLKQTEKALERASAAEKRANEVEKSLLSIIRPEEHRILAHLRMAEKLTQEMIERDRENDNKAPVVDSLAFTLNIRAALDQIISACVSRAVGYE